MSKEKIGFDWKREIEENVYIIPIQRNIMERLHDPSYKKFRLDNSFVNKYSTKKAPFGFNGFGELVYMRTYSRLKEDNSNEQWHETVGRVVNGTYNLQKRWIQDRGLEWSDHKAQKSAQEMYDRMFNMKFLPPGRGIWAMGSEITEERGLYAALNNCGFVSTDELEKDRAKPFKFLMDMSMLGVGVGFDTKGQGEIIVKGPDYRRPKEVFQIPDTREGWIESLGRLIDSHLLGIAPMEFDYSKLRPQGKLINGFGGKSSGPEPLKELHYSLESVLRGEKGRPVSSSSIVDMQNMIGRCVVAGNVRRTAEIALGELGDEKFLDLKNYKLNPERKEYGWTSNNSVFAELGMDYSEIAQRIKNNGEPGLIWLENIQKYGRMSDPADYKDKRAKGVNPCVEQSLESYELCNLVETFPMNHESLEDYLRTLKFSYLYAKTVTLGETHWPETNRVLLRNRRIGNSISGIQQFIAKEGLDEFKKWAESGYDEIKKWEDIYSEWLTVPKSIKTTSIKPSGTVSSVAGATPGMHWPISEYYIRRMRLSKQSELIEPLKKAGIPMENDENDKSSYVVEFPVHVGEGIRSEKEVPMLEQFEMVSFLQKYWADNQVSATIKFNPDLSEKENSELERLVSKKNKSKKDMEEIISLKNKQAISEASQIEHALNYFQYGLKGISMLPKRDDIYKQAPFEPITKEEYYEKTKKIKPIDFSGVRNVKAEVETGCSNDVCDQKAEELLMEENMGFESGFNPGNHSSNPGEEFFILYTTSNCPSCKNVKDFLNKTDISWEEMNVKYPKAKKSFNDFYREHRSLIERTENNTIGFPILSSDGKVFQGLKNIEDFLKNLKK
jgi:ribonucleoside-triphosphate reductase (thioredoxin)